MSARSITERLDDLIDELLMEGDVRSSSLVSMLTAVRESAVEGYHVALARLVWDARNALSAERFDDEPSLAEPVISIALPAPVAVALAE